MSFWMRRSLVAGWIVALAFGCAPPSDPPDTEWMADAGATPVDPPPPIGPPPPIDPPPVDPREMECATVAAEAESVLRPVDIVWVVDSSGSMTNEAARVQENMNRFAADIVEAGVDPHVVVITSRSFLSVPDPLGSDPEHYLFIDEHVGSSEPLRALLDQYDQYAGFLRENAVTHFVAVTDDESSKSAESFDLEMSERLGHPYTFHAIASEEVDGHRCDGAAQIGRRYYDLAGWTMGLTVSICTNDWGAVFTELSRHISDTAPLPCAYAVPDPPADLVLDLMEVNVTFTAGDGRQTLLPNVSGPGGCAGAEWHYDDPGAPTEIELCPAACAMVADDPEGRVDITLGCDTILL